MTVPSDAELAEYRRRAEETIAVQHAYQRGYNDGRAAAVPPRPATRDRYAQCTDDCTTDCGACKGAGRPAAPDATAGDGLRSAIAEALWLAQPEYHVAPWDEISETTRGQYRTKADAVLALPALRDVLAAAARDAEKVRRERDRHQPTGRLMVGSDYCTYDAQIWPCAARKALDAP